MRASTGGAITLCGALSLAELAAASVLRQRPAPPAILVAAYLVDADRVAEFRARADEIGARREDLYVVVTGPWPPYNFATEEHV